MGDGKAAVRVKVRVRVIRMGDDKNAVRIRLGWSNHDVMGMGDGKAAMCTLIAHSHTYTLTQLHAYTRTYLIDGFSQFVVRFKSSQLCSSTCV